MPILSNMRWSRFLGGGRLAAPVPALGNDILTNGDMELDANWASYNTPATNERSNTQAQAGTYSRHVVSGGSGQRGISQAPTWVTGTWYLFDGWIYLAAGTNALFFATPLTPPAVTATNTWTRVVGIARPTQANNTVYALCAANGEAYFDSLTLKPITLASMFSTRPYGTHVTVKAQATVIAGTRAGVVCNLDSASAPANFVIASHDGTTARLTKCVAGVYTELISTAVAYVAGAYVEIRRPAAGNNWQLFYNGAQVGTDQAIADAAIQAATLAGMFNTYSGNTLAAFSCVPS